MSKINCFWCSLLSLKDKTAIDRNGDSRTRKMFIKWRTDTLPQIISLDRLSHILWFVFCVLNGHSYDDLHKLYTTFGYWLKLVAILIHRQLHQRGHRESHGRRECWPPSLYTSTKTTAMNKDKCPRISHIKKLNILQFRSLAISTFWSTDRHVFCKHFSPFQTFAWCYLTKTWLI